MNKKQRKYDVETEYIRLLGNSSSGGIGGLSLSLLVKDSNFVYANVGNSILLLILAIFLYCFFCSMGN